MQIRHIILPFSLISLMACGSEENKVHVDIDSGSKADGMVCKFPPNISRLYCDPPPNTYSQHNYVCYGCNCTGMSPVGACNQDPPYDCRYFATGCIPKSYGLCDRSISSIMGAICKTCFSHDMGLTTPSQCNHLVEDLGVVKTQDGLSPVDGGGARDQLLQH